MNPKKRKEASVIPAKQGAPVAQGAPASAGIQCGWLELVRLPNLFTVPGDVLAGVALSSSNSLFFVFPVLFPVLFAVLMVSLFLYTSGLILNDYVDLETDRIERPRRPLPSGRVQPKTALMIAIALLVLALTLSFFTSQTIHENSSLFGVTCGSAVLILFYNCLGRKIPLLGFTVMGLCRGANILLGASLGAKLFSAAVVTGACVEAFYIAAVSSLAHQETKGDLRGLKRFVPLVPLVGLAGLGLLFQFSFLWMGIILFTFAWIFSVLWPSLSDGCHQTPVKIGKLIRALILIQSGLIICGLTMNKNPGQSRYVFIFLAFLAVLFFFSEWTGRWFYGS